MVSEPPVMDPYVVHYTTDGVEWRSFEFWYDHNARTIDVELEAQALIEEMEGVSKAIYECLPKEY